MVSRYGSVVLLTGASSGIGRAAAEFLAARGFRVYGTSRKAKEGVKGTGGLGFIKMIQLDVCSEESVKNAVDQVMKAEGRIDILINNAGMGIAGSVEDTSPEEAMSQFNTNFFGMHRVIRQVLPIMREQKNGLIINISSVAAAFSIPFQSMYSASKAAIEAMSGALRNELRPFGVKVALVDPGDTKTGFTGSRVNVKASGDTSAYKDYFSKSVAVMIKDETNGPEPIVVAKDIYRTIMRKNPPVRVVVGMQYKCLVFFKRIVPLKLESFVLSQMYKG